MDFLKKGQEMLANSGGSSGSTNTQQPHEGGAAPLEGGQAPQQGAGGVAGGAAGNNTQEDYGDKAFDFASKKSGHTFDRNTSEKITDGARGAYEKATGSKVDAKYSN